MERVRQVAGGVLLAAMTVVVVSGALYALWLGAPLLNPGGDRSASHDAPAINTDSRILRSISPAQVSPRAGVVQPAPPTAKPTATPALRTSPAPKHRPTMVARASQQSRGSRVGAKTVEVASAQRSADEHPESPSKTEGESEGD